MIAPRTNPNLFGQALAWEVLTGSLRSGRMPHAWLLSGPRGIGKATLAHRFARALLASPEVSAASAADPDDPIFRQCASGAHPDLAVLEASQDGAARRQRHEIGVDAVRAATAGLHRTAALGGRRVVVVDGAETLNRNAANALLKTLEEPPPETFILLVTHEPARIVPTIRSRCALLRLRRLDRSPIERILDAQAPGLDPALRAQAAGLAQGSARVALELATGGLEQYRSLVLTLGSEAPAPGALRELAEALRKLAESRGSAAVAALLQLVLARLLRAAVGDPPQALFAEEPAALERLAGRRPLEQWPRLWEKVARLLQRADALNLDRSHVVLLVLSDLANAPLEEVEPPAPFASGGLHVVG